MQPNAVNQNVFSASLGAESIGALAENMALHGLRQPIEVRPDAVILDGERRWRAAKMLGWPEVRVVVVHDVDDEDVAGYVLDAYATTRDANIEEKVALYKLALEVLRKRHGRPRGRPGKTVQIDAGFWSPEQIKAEAARVARFSSVSLVVCASAVLASDDEEVERALIEGEMSITAAYEAVKNPVPPDEANDSEVTLGTRPDEQVEGQDDNAVQTADIVENVDPDPVDDESTTQEPNYDSADDGSNPGAQTTVEAVVEANTDERGALVLEVLERVTIDIATCLDVVDHDGVDVDQAAELRQRYETAMTGFGVLGMRLHERGVV